VEGEPARPLEPEARHDEHRVRRERHGPPADVDHAEVDAVLGPEPHVLAVGPEVRVDVRVEELAVDLAEVGHARDTTSSY
jgi:hypothetical protein